MSQDTLSIAGRARGIGNRQDDPFLPARGAEAALVARCAACRGMVCCLLIASLLQAA
jgi:hypothetical protein